MIVVTGAFGFIGSFLVEELNRKGHDNIIVVDDFYKKKKERNLNNTKIEKWIHRDVFVQWFEMNADKVEFVYHLGARTDTAEMDVNLFNKLNLWYSMEIWQICTQHQIPLVYASSAATYGIGDLGFDDNHKIVNQLKPLNPYGNSKNDFDKWVLHQKKTPPMWIGTKFFNVYGPNEYHKGRMASVVFHAYNQIKATQKMKLFRSHNPDYKNGYQLRDFIYIKDIVNILYFLMSNKPESGLYNLGTGTARPFIELVESTFEAMGIKPDISFIDTPLDIRDNYQYFTEANMSKLLSQGYSNNFYDLKSGVKDYVQNYLSKS